ncbi:MAG: hydroxymethylpyrimidine/phosphomethylpyrimidine kinase [Bacteroidales bacterium]|jgi:hydroxymethylpyrimidine/phosphomethylpyrimidine kinase|nr:hydroxymethylpyrimidine/phosphomethylpyrimidine kinase [Bacteroidales bacterium]
MNRPYVLSIAGFDPCGGAGVLADMKVLNRLEVTGLAVVSALTYQNDSSFDGAKWCSLEEILNQLKPLKKYPVKVVKIGLIESLDQLEGVINLVHLYYPESYIIWDPILKSSAGFCFHKINSIPKNLSKKIDLITPNYDEYKQLQLEHNDCCTILLKGGHRKGNKGTDVLISKGKQTEITGFEMPAKYGKHGTGCVLSAAIAGYIALGFSEIEACVKGKEVVEQYMQSNETNLGFLQ